MEVDIYGDIENFDFGEQLEKVQNYCKIRIALIIT